MSSHDSHVLSLPMHRNLITDPLLKHLEVEGKFILLYKKEHKKPKITSQGDLVPQEAPFHTCPVLRR